MTISFSLNLCLFFVLFVLFWCNNMSWVLLQARSGIQEVHFLPFNPVDKRTAITYIDTFGNWHRSSKGAPEQVHL